MKFGKFGVFTMTDILDAGQLADLAKRTEELGYSALWYPEAVTYETFAKKEKQRRQFVSEGLGQQRLGGKLL